MKAVVFGGTGFIGGHVAEQLHLAGHRVTAVVRKTSNTAFLDSLGVDVVRIDFSDPAAIADVMAGNDAAYNCTADAKLHTQISMNAPVEIELTRTLAEEAAKQGISRFIQLSTVVIYDFQSNEPIDESYVSKPEYPIQRLGIERERVAGEVGRKTGMTTVVLRPASTIGVRDTTSFFARLFAAHAHDRYPMIGEGAAQVSLVDTRDIGRAMVWLGTFQKQPQDDGVYLLKGFDTTWRQLKEAMDLAAGKTAKMLELPEALTEDEMAAYGLSPFAVKTMAVNRIWKDDKIRKLGFATKYSQTDAVEAEVRDLLSRKRTSENSGIL